MELTQLQQVALAKWDASKKQLDAWKAAENEDRKEVIKLFSSTAEDAAGTETIDLNQGYKLKIQKSLDYKLDNKEGKVDKALENFSEDMAALLVKWKPELDVKNFKALAEDEQVKLFDCLTIKPASPQLKLEPPKA